MCHSEGRVDNFTSGLEVVTLVVILRPKDLFYHCAERDRSNLERKEKPKHQDSYPGVVAKVSGDNFFVFKPR